MFRSLAKMSCQNRLLHVGHNSLVSWERHVIMLAADLDPLGNPNACGRLGPSIMDYFSSG
jgi:hypothetical protein